MTASALDCLLRAKAVTPQDVKLAESLLTNTEPAKELEHFLDACALSDLSPGMSIKDLFKSPEHRANPYGRFSQSWCALLTIRPKGKDTPEELEFFPSVQDAPKAKRSTMHVASPDPSSSSTSPTSTTPSPLSSQQLADLRLAQASLHSPSPSVRAQSRVHRSSSSRILVPVWLPLRPAAHHRVAAPSLSIPPRPPPLLVNTGRQAPVTPPSEATRSDVPGSMDGPQPTTSGKTGFEVQTSHFAFPYLNALIMAFLTPDSIRTIRCVPQERSYHYGTHEKRSYLFRARPDSVLLRFDLDHIERLWMWVELKPLQRGKRKRRDEIRREECSQFVSISYEKWKRKQEEMKRRQQEKAKWQDIPGSKDSNADGFVTSESHVASVTGNEDKKHTMLMLAFDHDEFYVVVITFSDTYVSYITDMNSVVYRDQINEGEFATFQEIGPYKVSDKAHMTRFNRDFLALSIHELRKSSNGPSIISELESGLKSAKP